MADTPLRREGEPTPDQDPGLGNGSNEDAIRSFLDMSEAEQIDVLSTAGARVADAENRANTAEMAAARSAAEAERLRGEAARAPQEQRGHNWLGYVAVGLASAVAGFGISKATDNHDHPKVQTNSVPTQSASISSSKQKTINLFGGQNVDELAVGKAISSGFQTAQADQDHADEAKAAAKKRAAMLERANEAKTVPFAVKRLQSNAETLRPNLKNILTKQDAKTLMHNGNAQSSLLPAFEVGTVGPINGAEAVAYSIAGSEAFGAQQYNLAHGSNSKQMPEGKTFSQVKQYFAKQLSSQNTKFQITQPTGSFMNHGQSIDRGVFDAGIVDLDGHQEVITITLSNGKTLYYKIFNNNCVNSLVPVEKVQTQNVTKTVVSNPQTIHTAPKTKLVMTPIVSNPVHPPEVIVVPPTTPPVKPPHVVTPKTDDGDPGSGNSGVPADKDHGIKTGVQEPTEPVGGVSPPSVPRPPAPVIPAPQPPSSETQHRPPAETGTPTDAPQAPVPGSSNEQGQGGTVDPNSAAMLGAPIVLAAMGARRLRLKARQTNGRWSIMPNQEEIR